MSRRHFIRASDRPKEKHVRFVSGSSARTSFSIFLRMLPEASRRTRVSDASDNRQCPSDFEENSSSVTQRAGNALGSADKGRYLAEHEEWSEEEEAERERENRFPELRSFFDFRQSPALLTRL